MIEAEIKLRLIRLIVSQRGEALRTLYKFILEKLQQEKQVADPMSAIETGYQEMSLDKAREDEALDWVEGTLLSDQV